MKYQCEIEVTYGDWHEKLEKMAQAGRDESKWKPVADLEKKCGSCRYYVPKPLFNSTCYGNCLKEHAGYRKRSCPACKAYERK